MQPEEIEPDVDRAIEEMDSGRREMQQRSDELRQSTDAARHEWHARQSDAGVPGAVAPEEDDEPGEEAAGSAEDSEGSGDGES